MKKSLLFFSATILAIVVTGCWPGPQAAGNPHDPVIMQRAEFEASVQAMPQQEVIRSGKIYIQENLMFINDVNKGFHVFNYSNPQNPVKIGFINAPGATDLAVRGSVIYINQAVDLVTLQYDTGTNQIIPLHRNRNVFPEKLSPLGYSVDIDDNEVIVDWVESL